ncbi:MAG TPA: O-methyltransferase [Pyrinomonadaceae bacterium]|nr:O-methyltransferase [Pyrinomonadaceae bacterium]
MKARIDAIVQRDQAEYLDKLIPQTDPLLREMEAYGAQHGVPSADREVALFIEITARSIKAKRALEIGMAIGYTSLYLARAVGEDGLVVTIDPSDEMIQAAEAYLTRAGLRERVRIERGKALEVIPRLKDTFDLIFIDAVKEEYSDYLKLCLPRLRKGGVVIVDNLLWGGQVAGEIRSLDQESSTNALREFNKYFVNHPKLLAEVLSVGDGLGYAVKIAAEGFHRGQGSQAKD